MNIYNGAVMSLKVINMHIFVVVEVNERYRDRVVPSFCLHQPLFRFCNCFSRKTNFIFLFGVSDKAANINLFIFKSSAKQIFTHLDGSHLKFL